jgi:hypothetical protein
VVGRSSNNQDLAAREDSFITLIVSAPYIRLLNSYGNSPLLLVQVKKHLLLKSKHSKIADHQHNEIDEPVHLHLLIQKESW